MNRFEGGIDTEQWFFVPTFGIIIAPWWSDWKNHIAFAWLCFRFRIGLARKKEGK